MLIIILKLCYIDDSRKMKGINIRVKKMVFQFEKQKFILQQDTP
jgi:hypothetical protein